MFGSSIFRILGSPVLWIASIILGIGVYLIVNQRINLGSLPNKSPQSKFKVCSECGAQNPQNNAFCEKCGTKFSD
jgi:uncharacterized paraquat-inducible protein A